MERVKSPKIKVYRGISASPRPLRNTLSRSTMIQSARRITPPQLPPEILGEIMHRLPSSQDVYNLMQSHKSAYLGEKRTGILKKKYDGETEQLILDAVKEMYPRLKNKTIDQIPARTILDIGLLVESVRIIKYALTRGARIKDDELKHFMVSPDFAKTIQNLVK